jgi:hypothetical protein
MFASLLLPLVVAGAVTADSAILAFEPAALPAAAAVFGDPPVRIDLNERVYRPGDRARVRIRTEEDGHLLVFQVDTDGNLRVLFPLDPFDDSFVRGDRRIELDGRGDRETFIVEANEGQGWIYAAYSRLPFQVERYALGDHWDYRKLSPNRLPESPEPELTDLVRDIARASFDYDIIPYAVSGRQVARTVVRHYDPFYYDCLGCGYYGRYGSSITIRIGAPPRYYGGCWDAYWCDPYYYDPYYYRPRYVYYGPRYYRPYYRPPVIYRPHYAARNRPYYPGFGAGVPYRDRRTDGATGIRLVSDNTVYGPAPRRAASGFAETPARRQIEESPGYDLSPTSPGRRGEVEPSTPSRTDRPSEGRTDRPSEGRTTTGAPARRPAADGPSTTDDRPAAQPRTAEPRTRSPEPSRRGAEPQDRSVEPRDRSAEPRSEPAAPRRREPGPRMSGGDAEPEVEARPARPREERPATPSRARSEERAAPATRSAEPEPEGRSERPVQAERSTRSERPAQVERPRSADRPAQPAPQRRETPAPQYRSGGGERSSGGGGGGSARPAPSSDRGSTPSAPSGGGGRRRAD